jgi:nucleoside phosphorylase
MAEVDVLVVTALQEEFDAARNVASGGTAGDPGVASWEKHEEEPPPYYLGEYRLADGGSLLVALARAIEKGGTATGAVAAFLAERLRPRCLAMSGVCAGNPAEVVLGDVIFASFTYRYQEGKQSSAGFHPDHRQTPADESWIRAAQDLPLAGLSTNGPASEDEARRWVEDPGAHRARSRYIANEDWAATLAGLEHDGLITMPIDRPGLTKDGRQYIQRVRYLDVSPPRTLPYRVIAGPVASGDVVVKDGLTWDQLGAHGVETVTGLEMEAATVARTARSRDDLPWIVVKGVMDYADPRKDDRFKPFAARASAEVMYRLLASRLGSRPHVTPNAAASPVLETSRQLSDPRTQSADVGHRRWRPLAQPLPTIRPPDLGIPRQPGKAIVELCLLPAEPTPLAARRLAALPTELTALGREAGVFTRGQEVSEACGHSAVANTAGAGLAITREGQRCGWQELPRDKLGSVLDPKDLTARLSALLSTLTRLDVAYPGEAGIAVAVTTSILLAEGQVGEMPRTSTRGRTSMTPLRVPAADVLPWAQIAADPADVSAELSARLLLAFRSRRGKAL